MFRTCFLHTSNLTKSNFDQAASLPLFAAVAWSCVIKLTTAADAFKHILFLYFLCLHWENLNTVSWCFCGSSEEERSVKCKPSKTQTSSIVSLFSKKKQHRNEECNHASCTRLASSVLIWVPLRTQSGPHCQHLASCSQRQSDAETLGGWKGFISSWLEHKCVGVCV